MTGLYSPATATMVPAALVLVLVLVLGVRVWADSMEAPSGKRTEHAGFGGGGRRARTCEPALTHGPGLTTCGIKDAERAFLLSETSNKSCVGSRVRIVLRSRASASSFVSRIPVEMDPSPSRFD